jgi:uncharacterized membrane protein
MSSSQNQMRTETSIPKTAEELTEQNVRSIAELERSAQTQITSADRLADSISRFCGSMPFVWVHVAWFAIWIIGNTALPLKPIDPYPFSFLTLVVSLEAIFLSTFIMISENRQSRIDERRNQLDLQINLLAEQENTKTLQLLSSIAKKLGIDPDGDSEVTVLEQATRPEKLVEQIERTIEQPIAGEAKS